MDQYFNRLKNFLEPQGYINIRKMPDGSICAVIPYIYTGGLCFNVDFGGIGGRYCYEHLSEAVDALNKWDGEGDPPGNWIVKKGKGEDRQGPGSKY